MPTFTKVSALWEEGQTEEPRNGRSSALLSCFSSVLPVLLLVLSGS